MTTKDTVLRCPSVSVVVTNFNYAPFILECLRSIRKQTVQAIECVVVDDASTDESAALIEDFISNEDGPTRFELVRLTENRGQMNAFIEGFVRSAGDFVVFVDADDLLFSDFIETHLAAHLNPKYPVALTTSNEYVIDQDNRLIARTMEKIQQHGELVRPLSRRTPVAVIPVAKLAYAPEGPEPRNLEEPELLHVPSGGNEIREWLWTTTSATMFRRSALRYVLTDDVRDIRICADYYVLHLAHLLGGTCIIQTCHGAYRRHGSNSFASRPFVGQGTRAGAFPDDLSRANLTRRLEDDLIAGIDQWVDILGAPKTAQILASFLPARRVAQVMREAQAAVRAPYLLLAGPKMLKRGWLSLKRVLHFV